MRILLIGSALACIVVAVSSASADPANTKKYRNSYSSCYCDFGYPDHPCKPVVSCYDEGGRCGKSCPRQPEPR